MNQSNTSLYRVTQILVFSLFSLSLYYFRIYIKILLKFYYELLHRQFLLRQNIKLFDDTFFNITAFIFVYYVQCIVLFLI